MEKLELAWKVEIDILSKVDTFCKQHGLTYTLAFGSLLGAVRHKGFIPWDDDIDIALPRSDYEYLIHNWDIPGYIVQNKYTNRDFSQNFSKIRKDNTTFIQFEGEKKVSYHKGIYIDIFPADRVAPNTLTRHLQHAMCAVNLLYARDGITKNKPSLIVKTLLSLPSSCKWKIYKFTEKYIQRWNGLKTGYVFFDTIGDSKKILPAEMFDKTNAMEFEGKQYMGIADYDEVLTILYGDYLQLPPMSDRVLKHHPILISDSFNYEDLQ